jgi:MFS family permease
VLLRKYGAWPLIISAHIMIGTGFLLFPFTSIYWLLVVFAVVIGLGLGLGGPLSTSVMYDASPPDKVGEVIGLRMTLANVAQIIVPIGGGVVGAALGVGPVFWAVAACVLGDAWMNRGKLQKAKTT